MNSKECVIAVRVLTTNNGLTQTCRIQLVHIESNVAIVKKRKNLNKLISYRVGRGESKHTC
jgi:hypothetical protein